MNGAGRKLWVGVGISAVLLAVFFLTVDIGRLVDALASAQYAYLVPAIMLYLVAILFRTLRWRLLLAHMRRIGVRRLYPVVVVGYMANNLLPMRLGELVRSYYVGERESVSKVSALVTIFVERLLDALTLLMFIAVIAVFVPVLGLVEALGEWSGIAWPLLAAGLSLPFLAMFTALMLVAFSPLCAGRYASALIRLLPGRARARVQDMLYTGLRGLVPLRSPRTVVALFLVSVPVWLFEAGLFFVVGLAFGLDHAHDNLVEMAVAVLLVTAIANIASSIPAAPGGLGLFELVARETLVLLPFAELDRAVAAGYVAVVHASLLLPMIILGQVFLWAEHISLGRLSRGGRALSTQGADGLATAAAALDRETAE